jgi:N-acetylneuraminic acid mutarotase
MKKKLFKIQLNVCLALSIFNLSLSAQNFTWKKGSSQIDIQGTYGAQGTPAVGNNPGARDHAATWTDAAGNFWLFGGQGFNGAGVYGYLNDLWKYNPGTNQWVWVKGNNATNQIGVYGTFGSFASANNPGARYGSVTFSDNNDNLFLFGGYGYDNAGSNGELNDLWVYSITLNQWKWIKGANTCFQTATYGVLGTSSITNAPGARYFSNSWKDASGNFWILGGIGYNSSFNGYLSDLWRYTPSINEWTWINGSNFTNVNGVYGAQGTPSSTNVPGGRCSSATWTDNNGDLWLLGGFGFASTGPNNHLSDLWKYSIANNQWTWVKGYNSPAIQQGIYGTQGVYNSANLPGARFDALTWFDANGDLWLFGGNGFDTGNFNDYLNDVWRYNITTNQWKWVKGSNNVSQPGNYGVIGVNSPLNIPGSRGGGSGWKDGSNNLWLFGGYGRNFSNSSGRLNDLWKFDNCVSPTITISSTSSTLCSGNSATLTVSGANTYTWAGASQGNTLVVTPPQGTSSYVVYGSDANDCRDTTAISMTVFGLPSIIAVSSRSVICASEPVKLTATGAVTYTWSTSDLTPTVSVNPTLTTTYTVNGTDANGCTFSTTIVQTVSKCTGINNYSGFSTNEIDVYPNPSNGLLTIKKDKSEQSIFVIYDSQGKIVFEQSLQENSTEVKLDLPKGIYFYRLFSGDGPTKIGKLVLIE